MKQNKTVCWIKVALLTAVGGSALYRFLLWSGTAWLTVENEPRPLDVIIVLGYPVNGDGSPSPFIKANVRKAVELFHKGYGEAVIFTGGAVRNRFVEAEVMAAYAYQLGLPAAQILTDPHARDTAENLRNAYTLMQSQRWQSAVVVSNPYHTRRAMLLLKQLPFESVVIAADMPTELTSGARLGRILWEYMGFLYYWLLTIRN